MTRALEELERLAPGEPVTPEQVRDELLRRGVDRTLLTVDQFLNAESRHPEGMVTRVGLRTYRPRCSVDPAEASARARVLAAARRLAENSDDFTVAELLSTVNRSRPTLSQRGVYYVVRELRDGGPPTLVPTRWPRYRLVDQR